MLAIDLYQQASMSKSEFEGGFILTVEELKNTQSKHLLGPRLSLLDSPEYKELALRRDPLAQSFSHRFEKQASELVSFTRAVI